MRPERHKQIDKLFHAALACGPEQRAAFLIDACVGDESLRIAVESLLSSHEDAQKVITQPSQLTDTADHSPEINDKSRTDDVQTLIARPTNAFQAYQLARYHFHKASFPDLRKSRFWLEEALQLDINFGPAHAALAEQCVMEAITGLTTPLDIFPKAKEALRQASGLNVDAAEFHAVAGFVALVCDWNFTEAEWHLRKSLELNPYHIFANVYLGQVLMFQGRSGEAENCLLRAQEIEPMGLHNRIILVISYFLARDYQRIIEECDKILDIYPRFAVMTGYRCLALEQQGRFAEAVAEYENVLSEPDGEVVRRWIGYAYAQAGDREKALRTIAILDAERGKHYLSPTHQALVYAALGETDEAFSYLASAVAEHDPWMLWIATDPRCDSLRSDPRFDRLVSQVGLAAPVAESKSKNISPRQWQEIDELFHAVIACETSHRKEFLLVACADNEPLRLEVESLIFFHEESDSFIETPGDVAAEMLGTTFTPGQQINNYRIIRRLGAGGMGEVYLAMDIKLGRKVALKLLPEVFTRDADRVRRFEQEARAVSALNHPNILTIHEINEEGWHFIATEYVDGQTLRERLRAGPMDTNEVLNISEQIASALTAAHSEGIIHRDIKPENIMFRHDGIVKVLDFGLAKLVEDRVAAPDEHTRSLLNTSGSILMGTTHYMSPEQARGFKVDARTDIFSLGAVVFEMITGEKAFKGETSSDVIASVLRTSPQPLSHFAPDVPLELEHLVRKALKKDRQKRYATASDMLLDLRRLKQKRELKFELERTTSPDWGRSGGSPIQAIPTLAERISRTAERTGSQRWTTESVVSQIKRHKLYAALVMGIFVLGAIATDFLYSGRTPPLTDKDTVLIADFVNTTGDSIFDGALKQALSVQLAQSPFLNIFPEERIREALGYMDKPADERLTRQIAREICQRQGIKAMLVGNIASLGSHYVITIEAITQSGDSIAQEQSQAESKEQVLTSLGAVASRLRQKLGESLSSIQKYDVPIEQATTSSLDALKAFAMGDEERRKGREQQSLVFYQRAVELDPNFAMAHARIGVFYGNRAELELASQHIRKAYELRDRISERERLYITEKYHGYITGDILKTIQILEAWTRLYPNDYIPHTNLAMNYLFLSRYEESIKEAQEAIRLRPNVPTPRTNLIVAYLAVGRYDEAAQVDKELAANNSGSVSIHFNKYLFAFLRGDQETMNGEILWSRGKPDEANFVSIAALTSFYFGQLAKGEEETRRAVDLFNAQDLRENAAQALLTMTAAQTLFGKCGDAGPKIRQALGLSRSKSVLVTAALVLSECNEPSQAQSLLEEAIKKAPQDTVTVLLVGPVIRAMIETQRGNHDEAIRLLESIRPYDFGTLVGAVNNYARGQVHLKAKRGAEAAAEFQTIVDRRGVDTFNPKRALAYLGLARAAALSGDTARSRKAYQDFLALWKDADQNLPVLVEAKKEYARLNQ